MSDKQENSSNEHVEISISNNGELSEKKPTHDTIKSKILDLLGHPNRSATSLGEADHDKLEKFDIIEEPIEKHRTLHLINEEDKILYKEISQWVDNNPKATLEDTISNFDPQIYHSSDALAKVVHNYHLPDFIIRFKDDENDGDRAKKRIKRRNFELLLLRAGLILEHELDAENIYTYVKVIAPFEILCEQAQQIKLKMRLNEESLPKEFSILEKYNKSVSKSIFSKIIKQFTYTIDLKKESSSFKKDRLRSFIGAESGKNYAEITLNFFDMSRRNLLVHRMIITANQINKKVPLEDGNIVYVKRKVESLAIKKLIHKDVYDKFFPVHDGPSKIKNHKEFDQNNLRAQLNELWVKGYRKAKSQPLDKVREYFGEKVTLYFAWLGFYTSWLLVASIAGVIVVIYGLIYGLIDVASGREFGNETGISVIWDNALTAPYALLMAVWATCFLETWKRANASIQYDWDVIDYEKDELPRPEFYGTMLRLSLVTLRKEIHFPFKSKLVKFFISGVIVLISIGIVIVTVGVLLRLRIWLKGPAYIASIVTAVVNLITIIVLNLVYKSVAKILTNFENHKTYTQYEDSLIFKAYLFDFINFYSALIYIMFNPDCSCSSDACNTCDPKDRQYMRALTIQLAIIFVGKQLLGQIQEVLIPWAMSKRKKAQLLLERDELEKKYAESGRKNTKVPRWVRDDALAPSADGIRTEYEEIVIQFGFIALFGVAFPLAPLFALINNVTEIRFDAFKYIKTLQRPVGFQAQDLGMWEKILTIVSFIAILTNAIIIAFHSSWMENQFKTYVTGDDKNGLLVAKLGFILAFEHLVFIIKLAFAYTIPDVPRTVKIAIERENYLTRLAVEKEPPALDEYWSGNNDDSSLFSERGSLLLPNQTTTGGNIIKEKSKEQ